MVVVVVVECARTLSLQRVHLLISQRLPCVGSGVRTKEEKGAEEEEEENHAQAKREEHGRVKRKVEGFAPSPSPSPSP